VDTAPVFEAGEHNFDFMALPIESRVIALLDFVERMGRDAGGYAAFIESLTEPDRAVSTVGEHSLGLWQGLDERFGALMIAALSFGQMEAQWPSAAIAHDMQFARQTAAAASDTSG
jgi:hypothetical protein